MAGRSDTYDRRSRGLWIGLALPGVVWLLVLFVVPFYVMLTTAVKPLGEVQGDFTWWPAHATLRPFVDIWSTVPLARYFTNSLIVCVTSTVFSVADDRLSITAAEMTGKASL